MSSSSFLLSSTRPQLVTETSRRTLNKEEHELKRIIKSCLGHTDLLKFGRVGKPKWRKFWLSSDLTCIEWESKDKKKETKIQLASVHKISFGQKTAKFKRLSRSDVSARSFSLWYLKDGVEDTLDLVCSTENLFRTWTTAITAIVEKTASKKLLDSIVTLRSGLTGSSNDLQQKLKGKAKYEQALDGFNVVYRCGSNTWGQLGGTNREERTMALLHMQGTSSDVSDVASGWSHTLMLMSDGHISQMGRKMGTGYKQDTSSPSELKEAPIGSINSVSCGRVHNAVLTDNGDVFTWGGNFYGQLGTGDRVDRDHSVFVSMFREIKEPIEVVGVACGSDFTAAITAYHVYTWGCGAKGALGHGDEQDRDLPRKVEGISDPVGLSCGSHHMLVWTRDPTEMVYSWGLNAAGQLGLGHTDNENTPKIVSIFTHVTVVSAAAGAAHTLVITLRNENTQVWGFGSNCQGQLALDKVGPGSKILKPETIPSLDGELHVQEVVCGAIHSLARTEGGEVFASGSNIHGQLGIETFGRTFMNRFTVLTAFKDKNPRSIAAGGMSSIVMCAKKWLRDDEVFNCMGCQSNFTFMRRRHHCRNCCGIFCNECSSKRIAILALKLKTPQRVCDACHSQLNPSNQ